MNDHQKENTIPFNDLSAFYRQFGKREKMTAADIKAFLSQIPSENYFRIARTEDAIRVIGPSLPPNRYKFYYISLVTKGHAVKTIGLHTFKIKPNTLWFVPPGLVHSSKGWTRDARGFYITFSPDYLLFDAGYQTPLQQSPFFRLDCTPYLYLNQTGAEEMLDLFKKMYMEAKYLLYQSQLSIKEIAFHLRFEDASYFSRFFKKHTSSTPQEYQERLHL